MKPSPVSLPAFLRILAVLAVTFTAPDIATAEAYDFRFLGGGGGGTKPENQRIATSAGIYICLDVSENRTPQGSAVRFMLRSMIPQPASRIGKVLFDTGRHTNLFTNVSVTLQSSGITTKVIPPSPHAFLPTLSPDYWIEIVSPGRHPHGLAPGNFLYVSAMLAPGKTFGDVVQALNEGINPATAATGLRVGVIVYFLLGGPPPGVVGTISDDGGFVTSAISSRCQGR